MTFFSFLFFFLVNAFMFALFFCYQFVFCLFQSLNGFVFSGSCKKDVHAYLRGKWSVLLRYTHFRKTMMTMLFAIYGLHLQNMYLSSLLSFVVTILSIVIGTHLNTYTLHLYSSFLHLMHLCIGIKYAFGWWWCVVTQSFLILIS